MFRRTRVALAAISLLIPFALGCDYRGFGIVIDGFDEYQVQGVNLYRLNTQTNQYEPAHSIIVDRIPANWPDLQGAGELVTIVNTGGGPGLPAEVERDPADPDLVTIRLTYLRVEQPGLFRATLYNAAGESPPSDQEVTL